MRQLKIFLLMLWVAFYTSCWWLAFAVNITKEPFYVLIVIQSFVFAIVGIGWLWVHWND